jgi:hypothetical protein
MEDIINIEGGEKVEAKKRPRSPQPSKTKTTQNTKSPQNWPAAAHWDTISYLVLSTSA